MSDSQEHSKNLIPGGWLVRDPLRAMIPLAGGAAYLDISENGIAVSSKDPFSVGQARGLTLLLGEFARDGKFLLDGERREHIDRLCRGTGEPTESLQCAYESLLFDGEILAAIAATCEPNSALVSAGAHALTAAQRIAQALPEVRPLAEKGGEV